MSSKVVDTETVAASIKKVRPHPNQNEGLIFEKSAPGKRGMEIPPLDVPAVDPVAALGPEFTRDSIEGFPEVSEIEVIRHFTRLSTWNYAIDLGMYPLGSCTMKYNPRVNEFVARLDGLASEHPQQPAEVSQGCLRILWDLQNCLLAITGMDAATLQPAAGAQGELAGLLMIRAYLAEQRQSAQESPDTRLRARNEPGIRRDCGLRSAEHPFQRARPDRHRPSSRIRHRRRRRADADQSEYSRRI